MAYKARKPKHVYSKPDKKPKKSLKQLFGVYPGKSATK